MTTTKSAPPSRGYQSIPSLIFITTVHDLRKAHRSPIIGLIFGVGQTSIMFAGFYLMVNFTGIQSTGLRGDATLNLLMGIFPFMMQTKVITAVLGADGPSSGMMLHAPMNTLVATLSVAISALYMQILTLSVILMLYHILAGPIYIDNPVAAFGMLLLSWLSGLGIGICFYACKPWMPRAIGVISTVLQRVNMIGSGKMFIANTLPSFTLPLFLWNPLFHIIDQGRGFVFLNYTPRTTNWQYPLYVSIALVMIGFILESYTRKNASASWGAGK